LSARTSCAFPAIPRRRHVATKDNAVYLERLSETGDRLFEALLDPEEARDLAELLTKHAGKLTESDEPEASEESAESEESDEPKKSDDSKKTDESDESP
jgi:hypothetical protein